MTAIDRARSLWGVEHEPEPEPDDPETVWLAVTRPTRDQLEAIGERLIGLDRHTDAVSLFALVAMWECARVTPSVADPPLGASDRFPRTQSGAPPYDWAGA